MSNDKPFHMRGDGSNPSNTLSDDRPTETITVKQESLIYSQLLAAVAFLVLLPYLVLCTGQIRTFAYWCTVPVMLYGLWRGYIAWQYTKALRQYKLTILHNTEQIQQFELAHLQGSDSGATTQETMREVTVNAPILPKLFWNYDRFVFPAVVAILLLLGYLQFGSYQQPAASQETSSTNYVSPSRPAPSPESSAQPAPATSGSPMSRAGSTGDGLIPPVPSGREVAGASAMRLPEQWKPAGSGATRTLRVEGEHIFGRTLLREEDVRAGNSIVMDVKKRGSKYVGETTLRLVSHSGQGCTIHWPTELIAVNADRIEGRSKIPPGAAALDWNTCGYSLPSEWKSFTWLPVR